MFRQLVKFTVFLVVCMSCELSAQPSAFSLLSPANGAWASATPTFTWGVASGASFYRLYVDGNLLKDNLTTTSYQLAVSEALTEPLHTWYVVAVASSSGTTQSSQTFTAMIDATPPSPPGLVAPANNAWTANVQPHLQWNASTDAGSGLKKYQLWIDGTLNTDSISPSTTDTVPTGSNLTNGPHTWQIKAMDKVGNAANSTLTWTFRIDNVPPAFPAIITPRQQFYVTSAACNGRNSWEIRDTLNNVLLSDWSDYSHNRYYTYNDSVSLVPGSYTFYAYNSDGWGWAQCGSAGYFQIGNAMSGNGAYTVNGYGTSGHFTVGINGNGVFAPSGNIYMATKTPTFVWKSATDTGAGFQRYRLYVDGNLTQDNLADTFFTIANPLSYGQHSWIIRACDAVGNFALMFPMNFYVDNASPNVFNLLTPLDSEVVNIPTPNLTWQATTDSAGGSGLSKYQLWINGVNNIDSIPVLATTTAPSAVLTEGSYSWYINAIDKVGNVRKSSQTRTFFIDYNPPGAFTLISPAKGDTVKSGRPRLVWHRSVDAGSGIKRYVLNISGQLPDTIASADTAVQFPSTLSNGGYTWFVVANDRANNPKGSDTGNFVVNAIPPSAPILATPSNRSINQPTSLRLKWLSAMGADTYRLQVSLDSGFNSVSVVDSSRLADTTDSVRTAFNQNRLYYWRVNATNSAGTSAWSDIWSFTTFLQIPTQVSVARPVNAATITIDSIVFIWLKATPSIDRYALDISPDSLFGSNVNTDSSITDTTKTCRGLANKTTYWFRVKAHNSSGWGNYSTTIKFYLNMPTSSILPRAYSLNLNSIKGTGSSIRYSLPEPSHVTFTLCNIQGKLLWAYVNTNQPAGYYEIPIDLRALSRGCYFMRFKAGDFSTKRKLFNL